MSYAQAYLDRAVETIQALDVDAIEDMADCLHNVREQGGRLFILGSGGSAATASHATADFRKLCNIEAYCVSDNVAELTARTNDDGWDTSYVEYLRGSRLNDNDCILVLSVGGGCSKVSINLHRAVIYADSVCGTPVLGIVGRGGGTTAEYAAACLIVPVFDAALVTPLVESMHSLICHLLATHPLLKCNKTKWEEVDEH